MTPRQLSALSRPGRCAYSILETELRVVVDLDVSLLDAALDTATRDLLPYPRVQWPRPATRWEETVTALALTVLRLEGARTDFTRRMALAALREAVALLKQEAAA
jgi:hypothetical protein